LRPQYIAPYAPPISIGTSSEPHRNFTEGLARYKQGIVKAYFRDLEWELLRTVRTFRTAPQVHLELLELSKYIDYEPIFFFHPSGKQSLNGIAKVY
jgi:hypothetical protein